MSGARRLTIVGVGRAASACWASRMSLRQCFWGGLAVLCAIIFAVAMSGAGPGASLDPNSELLVDKIADVAFGSYRADSQQLPGRQSRSGRPAGKLPARFREEAQPRPSKQAPGSKASAKDKAAVSTKSKKKR